MNSKTLAQKLHNAFIFKSNGEIVACNETTSEDESKKIIAAFNNIANNAQAIGAVETLSIQGADSQLTIIAMNKCYLATARSREADEKIVKSLTAVIIPTVLSLSDQIADENAGNILPQVVETEAELIQKEILPAESIPNNELTPVVSEPFSPELPLPQTPANQFMVEKIGGLMVSSDTVRVDGGIISKWLDLYGDKEIIGVHIKTLEGNSVSCKFKPIKAANQSAKGVIQIPEKILQTLQTSKGNLVIVNPVISQSEEKDS